jgi:hypothetical protein
MRQVFLRRPLRHAALAVILGTAVVPTTAHASDFLLFGPQMLVLLGSSSVCVAYTYDQNGNRTLQTAATMPVGSVTWGSATFGCFMWSQ